MVEGESDSRLRLTLREVAIGGYEEPRNDLLRAMLWGSEIRTSL